MHVCGERACQWGEGIAGRGPGIWKSMEVLSSLGVGHLGSTAQSLRDVILKYWEGDEPGGKN